jgi:hypothetical protein
MTRMGLRRQTPKKAEPRVSGSGTYFSIYRRGLGTSVNGRK